MALTAVQTRQIAVVWAQQNFGQPNVVAKYSIDQIQAAASAVDVAFDTTLSAAVIAVGGATTVINGLSAQITVSMPGATASQQTMLACNVLEKRAGII
jgi:hypothetical protein